LDNAEFRCRLIELEHAGLRQRIIWRSVTHR
jgi:hypothetical protein